MKNRTKARTNILIGLAILFLALPAFAQVEFAGDITAVSTYVWRGIKANNGPALQSTAAATCKAVSLGFWGSSIDFGDDLELETDVYAEIALPTGDIPTAIGATVFMFDFNSFNESADAEFELYGTLSYDAFGLAGYYVPKQNSTKPYQNRSNYWLELAGATSLVGADVSATLGYGTYSSRWMPEGGKKDAVALLLLTAGKSISDNISVYWTYSLDLGSGFENILYFGGSVGL